MPALVLGPLLRYISETEATLWVETDGPCQVEVLGHRARTFRVGAHHYGLVSISGLTPGSVVPYEIGLDGLSCWPEPESPASEIRTLRPDQEIRLAFGSCRVAAPHVPPYTNSPDVTACGLGVDALQCLARVLRDRPGASRPDLLLLLGDQVYADEVPPPVAAYIRARRDVRQPPGEEVASFEEYTQLYRDTWGEPSIRWLFSTLPTAMIFDDHDLHDDWNISETWVAQMRAKRWWEERIVGAFMSYWIYQHLGNLSPRELAEDRLFQEVTASEDGTARLRAFAVQSAHRTDGSQWSYARRLDRSKLVVIDSRAGRVLQDGRRSMLDEEEWRWLEEQATGDVDHLVLATSVPVLLPPGLHHFEAWNEAVCAGAWGRAAAAIGERIRQRLDLEHWASFEESFARLAGIIRAVADGRRGTSPATITILSGDVHHAYLAQARLLAGDPQRSLVYQAVCSPFRHPLRVREQRAVRVFAWKPVAAAARALARSSGVPRPDISWRAVGKPAFANQVATLTLRGRAAELTIETSPSQPELPLAPVLRHPLTPLRDPGATGRV